MDETPHQTGANAPSRIKEHQLRQEGRGAEASWSRVIEVDTAPPGAEVTTEELHDWQPEK